MTRKLKQPPAVVVGAIVVKPQPRIIPLVAAGAALAIAAIVLILGLPLVAAA